MQESKECSPNYSSGGTGPTWSMAYDSEYNSAKSARLASMAVSLAKQDGGSYMLEGCGKS